MAEIRLTLREIRDGRLPNVCISCGRRACNFIERKYTVEHHMRYWRSRTTTSRSLTIPVPVCRRHLRQDRTEAKGIGDRSIVLVGVSGEFVDALWDIRDGIEPVREVSAAPPTADNDDPPVVRLARRPRPRYDDEEDDDDMVYAGKGSSAGWVFGIILGIFALIVAACMGLASLLNSGKGVRRGPPFGPGRF
jgi:hypothetical protein